MRIGAKCTGSQTGLTKLANVNHEVKCEITKSANMNHRGWGGRSYQQM